MQMNCVRCGAPLEMGARFCRNCGLVVSPSQQPQGQIRLSTPQDPPTIGKSAQPASSYNPANVSQAQGYPSQGYPQQNAGANMQLNNSTPAPRRRRRGGCLAGFVITVIILAIVVGGLWFFVLRPYAHDIAITQMDNAMSNAVSQIPSSQTQLIPPGTTLPVRQVVLNNLLVLNIAPSDPVQNTNIQISPGGVRLDFKLYGQPCTITGVPQAQDGKLVATNVTVSGVVGLVVSSDDITTLLNKHLADAQTRLSHTVTAVHLMDQEMDITLG